MDHTTQTQSVNPLLNWAWAHGILVASPLDTERQLAAKICIGILHQVRTKFPDEVVLDVLSVTAGRRAPRYERVASHVERLNKPDGFESHIVRGELTATISVSCALPGLEHTETVTMGVSA